MQSSKILLAALVAVAACAPKKPAAPVPASSDSRPRQSATNAELEQRVVRLELRLMERSAELEQMQARLDEARREVVRAMAKLQSSASRAEAASGIAEAELALETLKKAAPQAGELAQTRQLLASSNEEFERENYGGALYLATQSKAVAVAGQNRVALVAERGTQRAGEVLFALPLKLQTSGRANVREGPGTNFKVVFTLEGGADVSAVAYADQWVRISDEGGRSGWVSYSLIRRRGGHD